MEQKEIFELLKSKFGESVIEFKDDKPIDSYIIVSPGKIDEVCLYLRDFEKFQFDSLSCLSGVDYADGNLGVTYHLYSYPLKHKVNLKVLVSKDKPGVKTVSEIWQTADWHEREAYDMIGIIFILTYKSILNNLSEAN